MGDLLGIPPCYHSPASEGFLAYISIRRTRFEIEHDFEIPTYKMQIDYYFLALSNLFEYFFFWICDLSDLLCSEDRDYRTHSFTRDALRFEISQLS
jgi:hypothetical protein